MLLPNQSNPSIGLQTYFTSRGREGLVWLGIPAIGVLYRGPLPAPTMAALFAAATAALVTHILTLNDWAGLRQNPPEAEGRGLAVTPETARVLAGAALLSLAVSVGLFALVSWLHAGLAIAGAALSFLYSHPASNWKESTVGGPLVHLLFGGVSYALGRAVVGPLEPADLLVGGFLAQVLLAGQLVHQCIHCDQDAAGGVRTGAVRFGVSPVYWSALVAFGVGHLYLILGGLIGLVDSLAVYLFSVPLAVHLLAVTAALRRGVSTDDPLRYRNTYRALFGLALVVYGVVRVTAELGWR